MSSTFLAQTYQTVEQLLKFLATFGRRYRIWQGKRAVSAAELLAQLQGDPVLQQPCSLVPAAPDLGGKPVFGDRICYSTSGPGGVERATPSPYFLQDLLALYEIMEWLRRLDPARVIAQRHRDALRSTFLEHYYQDVLGVIPEQLATTRLPLWCAYLEGLIFGLDPNRRLASVEVRAETVLAWLEEICTIFYSGQDGEEVELDDGEGEEEGHWAAVETDRPTC